jgi:UbiD family decarboxylase
MTSPGYPDLHAHIAALEQKGLLIRVQRPINKDTEMHALVRWQFRGGISESQRKAFLFENVTDSTGRRYDIPVAVGVLASNREIYSIGIGCNVDHIKQKWDDAEQHQVAPALIENPPCQEIVFTGVALNRPAMASTRCRFQSRRPASTMRHMHPARCSSQRILTLACRTLATIERW